MDNNCIDKDDNCCDHLDDFSLQINKTIINRQKYDALKNICKSLDELILDNSNSREKIENIKNDKREIEERIKDIKST